MIPSAATTGGKIVHRARSISRSRKAFTGAGARWQKRQRPRIWFLQSRAELLSVEQTVLFDGATAYMDVLRDQAVLQLNINNETVLRRQLQAAQDRFQVGEITRTDVAQSESRLARATADRIQSESDLTASRAIYNNVIGEMPGTLRPPPPLEALPANEEEAVAMARNDAPDVGVALYTEKASRDDIRLITGELLPTLDLTGTLSDIREASSSSSRSESAKLTGRLVVPLYQSGSVASKVREAKQTAARRRAELADAVRDAIEFATRAWQSLQTTRARITSFQAQIRATGNCPGRSASGSGGWRAHGPRRARCRTGAFGCPGKPG